MSSESQWTKDRGNILISDCGIFGTIWGNGDTWVTVTLHSIGFPPYTEQTHRAVERIATLSAEPKSIGDVTLFRPSLLRQASTPCPSLAGRGTCCANFLPLVGRVRVGALGWLQWRRFLFELLASERPHPGPPHQGGGRRKGKQSRAEQSRAEQSRAEQSRAEQSRAEQSRAEQSRAEQSRAEQSRA